VASAAATRRVPLVKEGVALWLWAMNVSPSFMMDDILLGKMKEE
jgi:hypothetical protein